MAININSEAYCRKAYLNYHCYGNTMGISAEDMGRITQAWGDRVNSWQATVSSDETEYDFDDAEYARYRDEGEDAAKKATGYNKSTGDDIIAATGHSASALGGVVVNGIGAFGSAASATSSAASAASSATSAAGSAASSGASSGCSNWIWMVSTTLSFATGLAYTLKKPNKEEKEACDVLQKEMTGAQGALAEAQGEMQCMSDEIVSLSDEANIINEDTNEEIEEQKTEFDMYMQTYLALQEKIDNGEPLTDSEKELYKEVMGYMSEIGISIEEMSDDTTGEVSDLYDEIGTYQAGYDNTAETMGQIEGLTDYAASFDTTTQTLCYVEGAAQTLNAASGALGAYQAGSFAFSGGWTTMWALAFSALGAAGAVMSGIGAGQQFKWAGDVGTEIEMRKATQDVNLDTMDIYTEEIDAYDGFMQGVEDLELEIPDDLEAPEAEGFPAEDEDPNGVESTEFTNYTEILNEIEEGSKVVTENEDGTGRALLAPQYGAAIAAALRLPDSSTGGKFGQDAIPAIIAQLVPGYSPQDIAKVMNGGSLDSSYDASLIQTATGEDTGKDKNINNSESATEKLRTVINFYKPIFYRASQQGWKC